MKFGYNKIVKVIFVSAVLLFLTSCGESDGSEINNTKEDESRVVRVETLKLQGSQYTDYIKIIGQLKPIEKASLSHPSGGIIKSFIKDKGDYVNKGDTIAVIDNDVLIANLNAAKAQYELAQITYEKQEEIFKDNVNSEIQVLEAKLNRDAAKANYELIKAQLEDSYITAKFPGIVDAKYYEEGELAGPGMPIVNLININRIKAEAGLPERYVGQVSKGAPVKLSVKNITDKMINGYVTFIGNSVSTNNRTFPIEVMLSNTAVKLKPELVAELFIENKKYEDVITIPQEVAVRVDNGYEVFVVEDKKAAARHIEILNRFGDKIAVKSGLSKGEQLIVVGYQNLVHGQKVKIVN